MCKYSANSRDAICSDLWLRLIQDNKKVLDITITKYDLAMHCTIGSYNLHTFCLISPADEGFNAARTLLKMAMQIMQLRHIFNFLNSKNIQLRTNKILKFISI